MAKDENVGATNTSEQGPVKDNNIGLDENSKLVFPTLNHTLVTSSIEMDGLFAQLFKAAFADFTGFRPCWDKHTGRLTLTACFEQKQYPEDAVTAFEYGVKTDDSQSGLARIQSLYRLSTDGNRFHLTEAAKDKIKRFIGPEGRDRAKEVNWNSTEVVSQIGDPQTTFTAAAKTYNVVNYIDPIVLLKEVYGSEAKVYVEDDANGNPVVEKHPVEYSLEVIGPLLTQQFMQKEMNKYMFMQQCQQTGQTVPAEFYNERYSYEPVKLRINQIDAKVMEDSASAVGLQYRNQLGIDS